MGVGAVAAILLKLPQPQHAFEISFFDHQAGVFESLDIGPPLPNVPIEMDALLFGCGGVGNGWAYAVRRLPIRGALDAVDKQSLRKENFGPYVLSSWAELTKPKALVLKKALEPRIIVTPRSEPLEFYKIRLDQGLVRVPRLVVAGLDDIPPRHLVQRLWPQILVDMASGGTTTQLVVHTRAGPGFVC